MRNDTLPLVDDSRLAGIAFAFVFDESGRGRRILDTADIDVESKAGTFYWVNVNLADLRGQAWINHCPQLSLRVRRLLLNADSADRVEVDGGVLAGVMADAELALGETTDRVGDLRFAVGERLLVTARRHPLQALQALRLDLETEPGLHAFSSSDLFSSLIEKDVDRIAMSSRELARKVEALEDLLLTGASHDLRDATIEARRMAVRLHRQVGRVRGPFRSARLSAHQQLPSPLYGVADRVTQMLDVMHEDVHALQERARLAQEELSARLATSTNQQLYVLSIITAAFLPPTLVTGVFGMNTNGLPFKDDEYGFIYAMTIGAASAVLVLVLFFGVFRWLARTQNRSSRPGG